MQKKDKFKKLMIGSFASAVVVFIATVIIATLHMSRALEGVSPEDKKAISSIVANGANINMIGFGVSSVCFVVGVIFVILYIANFKSDQLDV